jgi:hypothetical protein
MSAKTDNHNPAAKLELRRYFLRKFHVEEPPSVLDCFQGSGLLWGQLRTEFRLGRYWGVDVKPKAGRLKIDSARILEQPGWTADVVDLDAYGSPWKHWCNLVRTFGGESLTVFVTIGMVRIAGGNFDHAMMQMAGCKFHALKVPNSLGVRLAERPTEFALAEAERNGLTATEMVEAFPQRNARYLGIRLTRFAK